MTFTRSNAIVGLLMIFLFSQCGSKPSAQGMPLENTYWRLAEFNGTPVVTATGQKEVHIQMKAEGQEKQLSGFGGCNSIGGSYTVTDNAIKFNAISTRMMCEGSMDIENFLQYALSNTERYAITDKTLELFKGDVLLAKFEGKPAQ